MTPMRHHMDALAAFDNYDWTRPQTAPALTDEMAKAMQELANPSSNFQATQPNEILRLYKAGAYKMHMRRKPPAAQEDIAMAEALLGKAYAALQADKELRMPMMANDDYYRIGNNLAFAMVNRDGANEETFRKADIILEGVISGARHDVPVIAFAQRIKGQIEFRRAETAHSFEGKRELVLSGVRKCLLGIHGLALPANLSEVARTHNNNAVNLLALVEHAPAYDTESKELVLVHAKAEAERAGKLWAQHDPQGQYKEFAQRTDNTTAEIVQTAEQLGIELGGFSTTHGRPSNPSTRKR